MSRVGLYADRAYRANPTGIGRYIAGLCRGIEELSNSSFDFELYSSPQDIPADEPTYWSGHIHQPSAPRKPLHLAWHTMKWPPIERLIEDPPDLYHVLLPHPFATDQPTVTTVHDITPLQFPEYYNRTHRWLFESALKQRIYHSDHIITISQSTQEDILDRFDIQKSDTSVVYYGIEEHFHKHNARGEQDILERYGLENSRYILFVGTINPRKNLQLLADGFDRISKQHPDVELVIVGGEGYKSEKILDEVTSIDASDKLVFPGYVENEDIPDVMAAADAFVMPSVYEGFGIPVLEAMACETPVIASNVSSLPEVVGDAGILVPPDDPKELATELDALLSDKECRREFGDRGKERASAFTWKRAAEQTASVYRSVLNEE